MQDMKESAKLKESADIFQYTVPEPGQLVEVRRRRWVVSDVQGASLDIVNDNGQHLVLLSSLDEDSSGEQLQVIWEIEPGRIKNYHGYMAIYRGLQPGRSGRYALEHRLIMERMLKRLLSQNEVVHHKDGNKQNNKIENLQVMTPYEHSLLHCKERWAKSTSWYKNEQEYGWVGK